MTAGRDALRAETVDQLTSEHFGAWIDVPTRGVGGYLYVIRDEYHDGYPSRYLVLVGEDGSAVEEEFTDSNPAGYPKTLRTPCLVRDDRPAECVGQLGLIGGRDALRAEIRDELSGWPLGGGYYQYSVCTDEAAEMADALLPHVERFAAEQVAAALNQAADDAEPWQAVGSQDLRARAAAVLAAPDNDRRQG